MQELLVNNEIIILNYNVQFIKGIQNQEQLRLAITKEQIQELNVD